MSFHWTDAEWCGECDNSLMDCGLLPNGCCPYCGYPHDEPDVPVYFTNAPKEYDYGYVTEVMADTGYRLTSGMDQDKPVRMIAIESEGHAGIQKDRNLSGLYPTLTSDEFTEWVQQDLLKEVSGD